MLGLHCYEGFTLVVEIGGYCLVVVHRLLIAVFCCRAQALGCTGSVVVVHGHNWASLVA